MVTEFNALTKSLEKKEFRPVYCADGDETYYLDKIVDYFEERILQPHERDFNLLVLYAKDVTWADVVNACRRFPMFAERQVVILKGAGHLKDLSELTAYAEQPNPSTILLLDHRLKKLDAKTRLYKTINKSGVYYHSEKLKESAVPGWIRNYGKEIHFSIGAREAEMLALYLGNDLQKITNEISKIRINVPEEKELTEAQIKKYIGFSHEFTVFELGDLITSGNLEKLPQVLNFLTASNRAAPVPLVVAGLYNHFVKIYLAGFTQGKSDAEAQAIIGWGGPKNARALSSRYPLSVWEKCLLDIAEYNNKGVGIDSVAGNASLLKDLTGRLLLNLGFSQ